MGFVDVDWKEEREGIWIRNLMGGIGKQEGRRKSKGGGNWRDLNIYFEKGGKTQKLPNFVVSASEQKEKRKFEREERKGTRPGDDNRQLIFPFRFAFNI